MHAPFWGEKLMTPALYKDDKLKRFFKQWDLKLGFELIKMRHAIFNQDLRSKKMRPQMLEELEAYIDYAQEEDKKEFLKDIYITNHEPRVPKYHTNNPQEDQEYFKYVKSLEEYNN